MRCICPSPARVTLMNFAALKSFHSRRTNPGSGDHRPADEYRRASRGRVGSDRTGGCGDRRPVRSARRERLRLRHVGRLGPRRARCGLGEAPQPQGRSAARFRAAVLIHLNEKKGQLSGLFAAEEHAPTFQDILTVLLAKSKSQLLPCCRVPSVLCRQVSSRRASPHPARTRRPAGSGCTKSSTTASGSSPARMTNG